MRVYLIALFLLPQLISFGQDEVYSPDKVILTLDNGTKIVGKIIKMSAAEITVQADGIGEMTIARSRVIRIRDAEFSDKTDTKNKNKTKTDTDIDGYPTDYYNATRHFINPSGYGLKKGQTYYENIMLSLNSFAYAVSDRFTIVGGFELSTLLSGRTPILYISPRFNFPLSSGGGSFSLGAIYFTLPTEDFAGIGLAQAAFTIGNQNNNVTIGIGTGFSSDNSFDGGVLSLNFSSMHRLSKKLSFVSDSFIVFDNDFNESVTIISLGLRFHLRKLGAAINVGLFRPIEDIEILALPFVSGTIPLN